MLGKKIIVDVQYDQTRVALLEDDELVDYMEGEESE